MKKNGEEKSKVVFALEIILIILIIACIAGKVLLDRNSIDSSNTYIQNPFTVTITDDQNGNLNLDKNTVVHLNAKFNSKSNNQYYYIWSTYYNDIFNTGTTCSKLPTNLKHTLTITGNRNGKIDIYSDSKCKNKVQTVKTKTYKCNNCVTYYNVEYNANGGKGKMNSAKYPYMESKSLAKNTFTRNNYYFLGWRVYNKTNNKWICYTDKNHSSSAWQDESACKKNGYVVYNDKQTIKKTGLPGETIVFYAKWQYNYKSGLKGFSGFERDPSKGNVKATIWPLIKSTIYKNSNGTSSTGKTVPQGKALKVLDMTNKTNSKNSYVKVSYNGTTGWINGEYVMINLPDVIPSVVYNITNASSSIFKSKGKNMSNVTGKNLYGSNYTWYKYNPRLGYKEYIVPMRLASAKKVQIAQTNALKYGNKIKIYDAFRPWSVQKIVRDNLNGSKLSGKTYCVTNKFSNKYNSNGNTRCLSETKGWFIALNVSSHNVGRALDVSMVSSDDNVEISTQTAMHELSGAAVITESMANQYPGEIALNSLFTNSGFGYLISEWWHFQDNSRPNVSGVENFGRDTKANHLDLAK